MRSYSGSLRNLRTYRTAAVGYMHSFTLSLKHIDDSLFHHPNGPFHVCICISLTSYQSPWCGPIRVLSGSWGPIAVRWWADTIKSSIHDWKCEQPEIGYGNNRTGIVEDIWHHSMHNHSLPRARLLSVSAFHGLHRCDCGSIRVPLSSREPVTVRCRTVVLQQNCHSTGMRYSHTSKQHESYCSQPKAIVAVIQACSCWLCPRFPLLDMAVAPGDLCW